MHSVGWMVLSCAPISVQRSSTDRLAAFRNSALSLEKSSGEGCRFPVAKRCRADAALPFGGSSIASRHAGRCPCFIDEYELFNIHAQLRFKPCFARRLHGLAFLLAGVQSFLKVRFHLSNWCQRSRLGWLVTCVGRNFHP